MRSAYSAAGAAKNGTKSPFNAPRDGFRQEQTVAIGRAYRHSSSSTSRRGAGANGGSPASRSLAAGGYGLRTSGRTCSTTCAPSRNRRRCRSKSTSSTLHSDNGNRTYILTTRRITSGDELKRWNGLGGRALDFRLIHRRYYPPAPPTTWPDKVLHSPLSS